MKLQTYDTSFEVTFDFPKDTDAITRCTENHDGWQEAYYPINSEEEVYQQFAYNCIVNGVEDISRLDGWADIEPGTHTMRFEMLSMHEWP